MAKLNAAARKSLPAADFAGPKRSYPIPDRSHAVAAEAYATRFASPAEKSRIDAAVARKFPSLHNKSKHNVK